MKCPHCDSSSYGRAEHPRPTTRDGIVFRAHVCSGCNRMFMSAQLVIADELEPVARLDAVLKRVMDESDARAQAEIDEAISLEEARDEE